ncbi:MAG: SURF1 family protein [Pseudomonadota bacterium]
MGRALFLILIGLGGFAVLCSLGYWQVQRLAWKESIIADAAARMAAEPGAVPSAPTVEADIYRPIATEGTLTSAELHVLTTQKPQGPGFRIITRFELADGRAILLDRGYVPETLKGAPRPGGTILAQGHLLWPRERDMFTPDADRENNLWFARDVTLMSEALNTEPILLVLDQPAGAAPPRPLPVTLSFPNNHLQYAITWFALAIVWAGMTAYWVFGRQRKD